MRFSISIASFISNYVRKSPKTNYFLISMFLYVPLNCFKNSNWRTRFNFVKQFIIIIQVFKKQWIHRISEEWTTLCKNGMFAEITWFLDDCCNLYICKLIMMIFEFIVVIFELLAGIVMNVEKLQAILKDF